MRKPAAALMVIALLSACASKPREPDWQMNAQSALERYVGAYMSGNARVGTAEFERARNELAATGQAGMVAKAELTRCAAQVASLALEPCAGFERLRRDAPAAERAYADYLDGKVLPPDVALLPAQHRAVAGGAEGAAALRAIDDPLARLIAAGVLFRTGRAAPDVLAIAVDTASQQGWRRPLLAWLGVQVQRAEQAGDKAEAERLRRRMALASGER